MNLQRPLTCKAFSNKIGQEQSIHHSQIKNDLKESHLSKASKTTNKNELKNSNLNNNNKNEIGNGEQIQQRKMSPPLFKYKPKFVAKQFDPFQELENKMKNTKSQLEDELAHQIDEKSEQQSSLYSMNSSTHKFKKITSQKETNNILSPIPPQFENNKNAFFEDDKNIIQQINSNQNIKIKDEQDNNDDNNQNQDQQKQQKQHVQKIRPQTAVTIFKAAPVKNIFDAAAVYNQYQKNEVGPQYNDDGQLKQYSVLGKPEWYLKQQKDFNKKNRVLIMNQDQSLNFDLNKLGIDSKETISNDKLDKLDKMDDNTNTVNKNISNLNSKTQLGQIIGNNNNITQTVTAGIPRVASMNNLTFTTNYKGNKSKKNLDDKDILVQELNEEELQVCIDKVIERVQSNQKFAQQQNQQQIQKFTKGDQLYLTKQQRILNKFDEVQKKQNNLIEYNCKQSGKKFQDSLWLKDGQQRTKIEMKQILEMVKTDFEKYGAQNFWQKRLRKEKEDRVLAIEAIHKLVNDDNPINFRPKNTFDDQKKVQIVEQIRKPISSQLRTEKQNELPFHSFKSHDYLQEKLKERMNYINEIARIDNKEIDNIEIIGKSVLKSEISTLKNSQSENKKFIMKIKTTKNNLNNTSQQNIEDNQQQKDHHHHHSKSPKNRIIFTKPGTATSHNTRIQSPRLPSQSNIRSMVKLQILPEKPAVEVFLEKVQDLNNQEEIVIEEKYIPYEMRRGGYVQQQIKFHY